MKFWSFVLCLSPLLAQVGVFDGHGDVGVTPKAGAAEHDRASGEYRVTGSGANIWGPRDAMHFVWKRVTGDLTLSADVKLVGSGVNAHRKVVLMVRQDLSPDSAYADIAVHGDGLTSLQYRATKGGPTQEVRSTVKSPSGPVKIERRMNRFTIYSGADMAPAGLQVVELTDPVYVGIGISSHEAEVLETGVFSNVQLEARPAQQAQRQRYRSKITIYDLASRSSKTLYQEDRVIEAPNWSRDGKFLLVNTGGNLYKLPVDGEAKLEKLDLGEGGYRCNNDHDFSKDGKWIAFSASSPKSRQSQVYVAKSDGTEAKMLTPLAPSYFHGWSPDGKWLAFVGQRGGKFELFRVGPAGGEEQRLTSKGAYDDGPEYTPDGKWIYFNSNRSGGWDIWRIPADGGGPNDVKAERVTSDDLEDWFPHFSPNGKQMLLLSFPKGTEGHNGKMAGMKLRLTPTPGKKLKPAKIEDVMTFFGGQGTINVNSWSPDSKRFAFVIYEELK